MPTTDFPLRKTKDKERAFCRCNLKIRMSGIISPAAGASVEDADQYGQFPFDRAGTDRLQPPLYIRLYGSVMKLRDLQVSECSTKVVQGILRPFVTLR